MEWIWERYKVSEKCTNKYTARHTISVPAENGQAGRAPDSRETIRVRVPIHAIFTRHTYHKIKFIIKPKAFLSENWSGFLHMLSCKLQLQEIINRTSNWINIHF